jgi:hypothetical protein
MIAIQMTFLGIIEGISSFEWSWIIAIWTMVFLISCGWRNAKSKGKAPRFSLVSRNGSIGHGRTARDRSAA